MPQMSFVPAPIIFKYMEEYRYTLEPYHGMASRHHCPACKNHEKTFSRYIDCKTGKYIDPLVGRCNRESNCGYHYTPRQYFQNHPSINENNRPREAIYNPKVTSSAPKPVSYIPPDVFKASLKNYDSNNFVIFLVDLFGIDITNQLIANYFIGTSKYWNGATVFWQIDSLGRVRTGKIMLYDPQTGKRVKEPHNHITWSHKALKIDEFDLNQCLFGEHLLKGTTKPIAVVESEKTAIIASAYLPQFIWVAVGGKEGLTVEKCQVLKGRRVVLFPDLGCYGSWGVKAEEYSYIADFVVSDLLRKKATDEERRNGFDIADYLIKFNYEAFANEVHTKTSTLKTGSGNQMKTGHEPNNPEYGEIEAAPPKEEETAESKYKTVGDIFDYYKNRGYKSLPKNIKICIPGWN